jgi:hypothetical protein
VPAGIVVGVGIASVGGRLASVTCVERTRDLGGREHLLEEAAGVGCRIAEAVEGTGDCLGLRLRSSFGWTFSGLLSGFQGRVEEIF